MLSGPGRAVSGLNHSKKHRGPQTAERIAAEAEADKTKANSSLMKRDIGKLLQPSPRCQPQTPRGSESESQA